MNNYCEYCNSEDLIQLNSYVVCQTCGTEGNMVLTYKELGVDPHKKRSINQYSRLNHFKKYLDKIPLDKNKRYNIISDFKRLEQAFCSMAQKDKHRRKNFINNQYILMRLLIKNGIEYPYDIDDYIKSEKTLIKHQNIFNELQKFIATI